MPFDARSALRAIKPEKRTAALARRDNGDLAWAEDAPPIGTPLLLDTCVYLDVLRGRTADAVDMLLMHRLCHHSAVSLSELTHVLGRLDPRHADTRAVLSTIHETIDDIPARRLHAPDTSAWGTAGILTGLLARLTNAPKNAGHERRFLNDALILLQARSMGAVVLTANIGDFDFLTQLVPDVSVLFYRATPA